MMIMQTTLKHQLKISSAHQSMNHLVNQFPVLSFLLSCHEKRDDWLESKVPVMVTGADTAVISDASEGFEA